MAGCSDAGAREAQRRRRDVAGEHHRAAREEEPARLVRACVLKVLVKEADLRGPMLAIPVRDGEVATAAANRWSWVMSQAAMNPRS